MNIDKVEKLVANLHDKTECYSNKKHKSALNYGLVLKNVHSVIRFNQKVWLKSYININIELKQNAKNDIVQVDEQLRFRKNCGKC